MDVNFTLYGIQDFGHKMNEVAYSMKDKLDAVDDAVGSIRSLVSTISGIASNSMATMAHDRSVAYQVRSSNNKKLEEISNELGNLRNTNTEGCNNSAIQSKEREYDEVRSLVRELDNIISKIDALQRKMESNVATMKNNLFKIENARDRFKKCFNEYGPYGTIQKIERKTKDAHSLGARAMFYLSLNDKNYSSSEQLSIVNIDCLRNTSYAVAERQRSISNCGQELLKTSHVYSDMMQSEVMRGSFATAKELFDESEAYSKFLGTVSSCLKDAYSVLLSYKNLKM